MQAATIHLTRRIDADPTSAALLLAADAGALLGTDQPIDAVVRAEPPVRTPTSFVIRFSVVAGDLPPTDGTLRLSYASADDDGSATDADLRFTIEPGPLGQERSTGGLHDLARTFLANLAAAAEQRSRAA
jgi:hypothetical protein